MPNLFLALTGDMIISTLRIHNSSLVILNLECWLGVQEIVSVVVGRGQFIRTQANSILVYTSKCFDRIWPLGPISTSFFGDILHLLLTKELHLLDLCVSTSRYISFPLFSSLILWSLTGYTTIDFYSCYNSETYIVASN